MWSKPRLSVEFIESKMKEWVESDVRDVTYEDEANRDKPWEKKNRFNKDDVDGNLNITLSNGIYVDVLNLKPAIQNKIRRMAAIRNPIYYKNQVIGTTNFDTSQWVYLGKDHLSGYIEIPRGLYEELLDNVQHAGIDYEVTDERQKGKYIDVSFRGKLRDEQKPALEECFRKVS